MANPVFPTLSRGDDSSKYSVELEDPAMKTSLEGGYVSSRAKHTRTPRKTWKIGYTLITNADKALLDAFWATVRGGSVVFDWTDPVSGTVFQVRFADKMNFQYVGRGNNKLWDLTLTLEQA